MGGPCQDKSFFRSLLGLSPGHWQERLSARPRGVLACDLSPYPCCLPICPCRLSICPCGLSSIPVVCPSVPAAAVEIHDYLSGDWWLVPSLQQLWGRCWPGPQFPLLAQRLAMWPVPILLGAGLPSQAGLCIRALDLWRIISDNFWGLPSVAQGLGPPNSDQLGVAAVAAPAPWCRLPLPTLAVPGTTQGLPWALCPR